MSFEAKKFATYEDLFSLPDHLVGEIISGELITSPRPGTKHTRASSSLGAEISPPFSKGKGGPGGWIILDEPELHLGSDILVPDLAGWKEERLFTHSPENAYFQIAPDWICEVLSPSTIGLDRIQKLPIYAREKVSHVWLIDPIQKTLEVYQRFEVHWLLMSAFSGHALVKAVPFDAIEIDLSFLWWPEPA